MYKYDLAVIGGYEYDKNYFIVDCRKSNVEYIVESLKKSKLSFRIVEVKFEKK